MSLIKLAVYGGIGYLVYQTFFADAPIGGGTVPGISVAPGAVPGTLTAAAGTTVPCSVSCRN